MYILTSFTAQYYQFKKTYTFNYNNAKISYRSYLTYVLRTNFYQQTYIFRIYNLKQEEEPRVTSLGKRSIFFWVTAVICWLNDRLYCEVWSNIGFPYLHGFWHVLIFLAAYTAVVLFAYFEVKHNHPHEVPMIEYWPKDSFELGIPFVQLKRYHLNKKEHNI